VLSWSQVEDLFDISYQRGAITVHTDDGDIVFERRNGLYVADFSAWASICATVTTEREELYTKREIMLAQ